MRSYSVAVLVLTMKPRQTNTVLSCNTTEERFNSTRTTEGRDLYLTEIKSDIGEFSHLIDLHGVCGNNNKVSFVTNLLVESVFGKKIAVFHVFGFFKFKVTFRFSCLLV